MRPLFLLAALLALATPVRALADLGDDTTGKSQSAILGVGNKWVLGDLTATGAANVASVNSIGPVVGSTLTTTGPISGSTIGGSVSAATVKATGSTSARALADRFAEKFNVKDFGALCDGTTDDTAKIQAAITAAGVYGGRVVLPLGVCKVTDALSVTASNVTIEGEAMPTSVTAPVRGSWIKSTATAKDIIRVDASAGSVVGFRIANVGLFGNVAAGTSGSCLHVVQSNVSYQVYKFTIENVLATRCKDFGVHLDSTAGFIWDGVVTNLHADFNGRRGYRVNGNVQQIQHRRLLVSNNVEGNVALIAKRDAGQEVGSMTFDGLTIGDTGAMPAWAASQLAYLGEHVTNDSGKVYECITQGTTAASGGPTGTTADITDGTAHWGYAGASASAGSDGLTVRGVGHLVFTETYFEGVAADAYNLRVQSARYCDFRGGNLLQGKSARGVQITTRDAIATSGVVLDFTGWTNNSALAGGIARSHIELSDSLASATIEGIYYGRLQGEVLKPSYISGWAGFFYNQRQHFLYEALPVDSSGSPGNATAESQTGASAIASGATTCVVTNPFVRSHDGTSTKVVVTPLDIDANVTKWKVSVADGSFTVTVDAAPAAAWKFAWHVLD